MNEFVVKVKEGLLKGVSRENIDGGKYIVFQGIPYAAAPVGNLRFQDPQPPLPWSGIRNSLENEKQAGQIHLRTGEIIGDDDCLYLNIATNSLTGKKAVMVWIHGGAFSYSSSDLNYFGPDYLLKNDIVFVSLNYRLGFFGFLNLNTKDCSGNQGLKDQVCALKWIQENIETFGGDSKNITIFGCSSGSTCVHYHCISPLAKGLFQKAICQSGVAVSENTFQSSNKEFAFKMLEVLGKKIDNPEEAVQLFRNFSTREILQAELKLVKELSVFFANAPFLPTLDIDSENPFLPQPLEVLVENGINVPLMMGFNNLEGNVLNTERSEEVIKMFNENFGKNLASHLNLDKTITLPEFVGRVEKFYFEKNPITIEEFKNIVKYRGDVCMINGIQFIVEKQRLKKTPTFMYRLAYKIADVVSERNPIFRDYEGAGHAEDNFLLFYRPRLGEKRQIKKGTKDYLMMQIMTKLWTNFAKTGDPTSAIDDLINIKWKPISNCHKFYLNIDEEIALKENPEEKSWNLWKPFWSVKKTNQN
ncbi:esterase FE4-like [Leptopilina heterotoma]|uniref:esterase FE4-like n=1 Tax=Leptopilina heterotoma TaxID=63436 RepID=UPI001CAA3705|nr:esterase FE4-like [Leptopilina heterotoma]